MGGWPLTGGSLAALAASGISASTGTIALQSVNAGAGGTSKCLEFSAGTAYSGNSGMISVGVGGSTEEQADFVPLLVAERAGALALF